MDTEHITIQVEAEAARAFRTASPQDKKKLELLLSLRLLEATKSTESLSKVMREISQKAQKRGLTDEFLTSFLPANSE